MVELDVACGVRWRGSLPVAPVPAWVTANLLRQGLVFPCEVLVLG